MNINKSIKIIMALPLVAIALMNVGCSDGYTHLKSDQLKGDVIETTTNAYTAEFKFGEWVEVLHNERTINKYDENGNFSSQEEYSVTRKGAVKLRKMVKYNVTDSYNLTAEAYDGDGNLVNKTVQKKVGNVVTLENYDQDGALINTWTTQLSDKGARLEGEISLYRDGKVTSKGNADYKSDEKGRMLEEIIVFKNPESGNEEKYITKRAFDNSDFLTTLDSGDGESFIRTKFEYLDVDAKGNWTKRLRTLSIEGVDTKFIEKRELVYKK